MQLQIFVAFTSHIKCELAQKAFNGLKIYNRVVVASFFDPEKYQQKQF